MISQLNKHNEFKRIVSPLKYQTRCVTAFPDQQGFLITETVQLKCELVFIIWMILSRTRTSHSNIIEMGMRSILSML
ncbi:unnamed protein product [Brassica napus]|uniref:(rape) hypothetical protein n=1 Tax=Brassica napus TaxID=3708 RepID=A0A817B8N3_BRANA|nr:unnamed protein product [Brassica napus]